MSPRVVSLVPSATETLLAWGVVPVACTRFCEQPELVHVGGTKDPDVETIIELAPDLVVLCEEENRRQDHDRLVEAGLSTFVFEVDAVDDVAPALERFADVLGLEPPDLHGLGDAVPRVHRTAFVPIWRRPWMTISRGTYGASLLDHLGIEVIAVDGPDRYPTIELEDARAARPDVVLAPSEPYPFRERHVAELEAVAPVELIDGRDLFWWGARTSAAIRRLGERLR